MGEGSVEQSPPMNSAGPRWLSPNRRAALLGMGAAVSLLALLAPLTGPTGATGSLGAAPWDAFRLGATAPPLASAATVLTFFAALIAGVGAGAGKRAPSAVLIGAGTLAALALWAWWGLPQFGASTPLTGRQETVLGLPFIVLAALQAAALLAFDRPGLDSDLATTHRRRMTLVVLSLGALQLALLWVPTQPSPLEPGLVTPALSGPGAGLWALSSAIALGVLAAGDRLDAAARHGAAGIQLACAVLVPGAMGSPVAILLVTAGLMSIVSVGLLPLWTPGSSAGTSRARISTEAVAVVVVFALYFLLKTHGLRASTTDENIYFYGAKLWADGQWPYRDFFFAHPPVHLLVPAILFKLFGFSLTLAKLIAPMAVGVAGLFVWLTGRHCFGRPAALLALVLFLFASEILKASTNLTGVNLTLMFISAGAWAVMTRRPLVGGVLFALAAQTGFYAMAGALAFGTLLLFQHWKNAARYAVGFAVVFGLLSVVFSAIGGEQYTEGVYTYHALKPIKMKGHIPVFGDGGGGIAALWHNFFEVFVESKRFWVNLYYHGEMWCIALAAGLLAFVAPAVAQRSPEDGRPWWHVFDPRTLWDASPDANARILWMVGAAYFVQMAALRELYDYYFVIPFFAMALAAGYGLQRAAERIADLIIAPTSGNVAPALLAAVVGLSAVVAPSIRLDANAKAWPEEQEKIGELREFEYNEPPILVGASGIVRALYWRDFRVRGQLQPGPAHYLWSKKRYFSIAEEVAEVVRNSPEGTTITGASTVAPLIALLADRPLAANEVDTNTKRIKSGILTYPEFFERVCSTKLGFIISSDRSMFSPRAVSRWPMTRESFRVEKQFSDPMNKHFGATRVVVLKRKAPLDSEPPACKWTPPKPRPRPKRKPK